jgi:hypothetical protein
MDVPAMRRSSPLAILCGCVTVLAACGGASSSDDEFGTAGTAGSTAADDDATAAPTTATADDDATDEASSSGSADESEGDDTTGGPAGCDDPNLGPNEQMLVDMPADSWLEIQGTQFGTFCAKPEYEYLHGVEGCPGVINDWCGAAWDPVHGELLVWGGGHDGYWGNEVYGFDPVTMAWRVVKEPSPSITPDNQNQDPLADGTPVSRHTYDQMQYITHADVMWSYGGAIARNGFSTTVTWTLDVTSGTWTNMAPPNGPLVAATGTYNAATAYDPESGLVLYASEAGFATYDIDANAWTQLFDFGFAPYYPDFTIYGPKRGVVDPVRRLFYAIGDGQRFVYAIDTGEAVLDHWSTTGDDGGLFGAYGPGVDYDVVADALVGWTGGSPRILDLETQTWSAGSDVAAPPAQVVNGTYGRWRYVERYNVFVLVNQPEQNVYFYKHTAGCG